jgi:hypothetical protein
LSCPAATKSPTPIMLWAFAEKRTYQFSDTHSPTKFIIIPITYAFKAVPNRLVAPEGLLAAWSHLICP